MISTATNTVTATIPVGSFPFAVAVTPDGSKVYVANQSDNTVSVLSTATNMVVATIPNRGAAGLAVTPDGGKVYEANGDDNTVSVIATATNTVIGSPISVGSGAFAFGVFIQPRFAGTRGHSNCYGQSVAALARTFGGLNAAAAALGYSSVTPLQNAIMAYCGG